MPKKVESKKNKVQSKNIKTEKYIRWTWDEYFMKLVNVIGGRSTCDRGRPGCIIIKDHRVLTTGYAGSPLGLPHCDDVGHEFQKMVNDDGTISEHCVRTVHAEVNAVCQSAKNGVSIDGSTLYIKFTPCYTCAKMLINAGIKRVVAQVKYHAGDKSTKLFKKAGVKFELLENKLETYDRM